MKKIGERHFPLSLFILIHFAALAAFGITVARGKFSVSSDLFSMIPETSDSAALKTADKKLTGNSGKSVFILSRNEDFAVAKKNAEEAYQALKAAPEFSDYFERSFEIGLIRMAEIYFTISNLLF